MYIYIYSLREMHGFQRRRLGGATPYACVLSAPILIFPEVSFSGGRGVAELICDPSLAIRSTSTLTAAIPCGHRVGSATWESLS